MKNRLRWFVHDIIVAATWVGIFVVYYFAKARVLIREKLFGGKHGRR